MGRDMGRVRVMSSVGTFGTSPRPSRDVMTPFCSALIKGHSTTLFIACLVAVMQASLQ